MDEWRIFQGVYPRLKAIPGLAACYNMEQVELVEQRKIGWRTSVHIWGSAHLAFCQAVNYVLDLVTVPHAPIMLLYDPLSHRAFYYDIMREQVVDFQPSGDNE